MLTRQRGVKNPFQLPNCAISILVIVDLARVLNEPSLGLKEVKELQQNFEAYKVLQTLRHAQLSLPSDSGDAGRYFDTTVLLLARVPRGRDGTISATVMDAFERLINLCVGADRTWLLHSLEQISRNTWQALKVHHEASTADSLLLRLYADYTTILPNLGLPLQQWALPMASFLDAQVAPLAAHFWTSIVGLCEEQGETGLLSRISERLHGLVSSESSVTNLMGEVHDILLDRNRETLKMFQQCTIGNVVNFTNGLFDIAAMQFDVFALDSGAMTTAHAMGPDQAEADVTKIPSITSHPSDANSFTPLTAQLLAHELPHDAGEKLLVTESVLQQWIRSLGIGDAFVFQASLKKVIEQHYPNNRKSVLDLAIAQFMYRHPEWMPTIVSGLVETMFKDTSVYNIRNCPFYAIASVYTKTITEPKGSNPQLRKRRKTYNVGHVDTCAAFFAELHSLTLRGTTKNKRKHTRAWLSECIKHSSNEVVASFVARVMKDARLTSTTKNVAHNIVQLISRDWPTRIVSIMAKSAIVVADQETLAAMLAKDEFRKVVIGLFESEETSLIANDCVEDLLYLQKGYAFDSLTAVLEKSHAGMWRFLVSFIHSALSSVPTNSEFVLSHLRQVLLSDNFPVLFYTSPAEQEASTHTSWETTVLSTHRAFHIPASAAIHLWTQRINLASESTRAAVITLWRQCWMNGKRLPPVNWILCLLITYGNACEDLKTFYNELIQKSMEFLATERHAATSLDGILDGDFVRRIYDLIFFAESDIQPLYDTFCRMMSKQSDPKTSDSAKCILRLLMDVSIELNQYSKSTESGNVTSRTWLEHVINMLEICIDEQHTEHTFHEQVRNILFHSTSFTSRLKRIRDAIEQGSERSRVDALLHKVEGFQADQQRLLPV
ncbi:hypothetical protein BZG36_01447 [Bifiguratus adelaidae]|uniref:Uncharacterized protein n=1 Tax=Bifiguratus adelaidae TaxID=1938954 RepID=A0A261Y4W6_9FUNG|nr:hypothetical protein BZG36_01447 [Bifiguratus adelaidae]